MHGDPLLGVEPPGEVGEKDEVGLGDPELEHGRLEVQLALAPVLGAAALVPAAAAGLPVRPHHGD